MNTLKNKSGSALKQILNSRELRITIPRLLILKVLSDSKKPVSISDIHSVIKIHKIDLATVYRTINAFHKKGIITDVDFKDDFKRFELVNDRMHHHHVVCKKCKSIEDIELCFTNEIEQMLQKRGYTNLTHSLEFFGVCRKCNTSL